MRQVPSKSVARQDDAPLFPAFEFETASVACREDAPRIDAERVTLQWKFPGREFPDLSETPLFGGPRQRGLFPEEA